VDGSSYAQLSDPRYVVIVTIQVKANRDARLKSRVLSVLFYHCSSQLRLSQVI
jgi:hypothetical protein